MRFQTRVEVITRPQLIEAYVRIRTTRDNTFIQVYAQMDEQYKEVGCPSFQCLTDILDWTVGGV